MQRVLVGAVALMALALCLTAARPTPPEVRNALESSPRAVVASLVIGMDPTGLAADHALLLPVDPDSPPRASVKPARGALPDETGQWLLESRPAGVTLSLPLPDTRKSLPVILPDDE